MAQFTVLEPPDGKPERVAVVRDGFSLWALLFTVLWALWNRMWVVAMLLFALSAVLMAAVNLQWLPPGLAALIHFGIALIFGFEARNLQVRSLERAGFGRAEFIVASGREAAELGYFASRVPAAAEASPIRIQATHDDTLGIFGKV